MQIEDGDIDRFILNRIPKNWLRENVLSNFNPAEREEFMGSLLPSLFEKGYFQPIEELDTNELQIRLQKAGQAFVNRKNFEKQRNRVARRALASKNSNNSNINSNEDEEFTQFGIKLEKIIGIIQPFFSDPKFQQQASNFIAKASAMEGVTEALSSYNNNNNNNNNTSSKNSKPSNEQNRRIILGKLHILQTALEFLSTFPKASRAVIQTLVFEQKSPNTSAIKEGEGGTKNLMDVVQTLAFRILIAFLWLATKATILGLKGWYKLQDQIQSLRSKL